MIKKIAFFLTIIIFIILNIILDFNIKNYILLINMCFGKNIILSTNLIISISSIIALISILMILDILLITYNKKNENKGIKFKKEDGTFGTANWMNENEIKQILGFNDVPGIILGKYKGNIVKLPFESYFNKNISVFGSSGSMKTISFVLTNLLELSKYKKSIVVTDPKSEIYRITSSYFSSIGYTVKVFNLKDTKHSDRWNPLAENENINDIQTSASVIISNTQNKNGKDDFWPRAEENLLKAFEFYFLENLADTIKASVITGLGTRLQAFQNEDLQNLTNATDIDLTLTAKQPCIFYVITSDVDSSNDFLASLFFTFLFIKLVRYADSRPNGRCDIDVFCFLDEFANIGAIPDFNRKISTVRSRGIALIPILQNIGQIKNRYPNELWQEIIGNTDTRLSLGTTDTLTAQYFCDSIGISTVETESIRKLNSFEGDISEFGQKNISSQKRNLLNVDEILRLPSEKLLVILRGNKPLLLDKMIYKKHPLSNKLKDSSIYDYIPTWTRYNENKKEDTRIVENKIKNERKDKDWDNF